MKLGTIIKAHNAMRELSFRQEISAQLAYLMAKFLTKTESDMAFYGDQIRLLFKKHNGEIKDDGKMIVAPDEVESFNKDVADLENTEAEDPDIRFPLSLLSQELKLSAQQMCQIIDFVDEEK